MRIGVDTGGTFTDCVILKDSRIEILKVFSTPEDATEGILEGVRRLVGHGQRRRPTLIHGTTVGTNSVLERRGALVALVTTAGFEDLIEIGRQNRPRLYDLNVRRDPALVPRALRWGAKERTAADGKILTRPDAAELARLRRAVKRSRAESVAICFLFSFANSANERAVARALRDLGLPLSVSHVILPEFREYERLSTVVINAFLAPRLGQYLDRLDREAKRWFGIGRPPAGGKQQNARLQNTKLQKKKRSAPIFIMQSSGGITTAARAAREPVRTILSGPAGGVVATRWLADRLGIRRVISFDMGGTSTDVCLLDGPARTTHETTLGGLPVAVPVLDVHSVGAGGGSLARLDAGGALRVGPESSGAVPGPICYGRGGTQPAVTDAHLLLGRLDPEYFLGGEFPLDAQATQKGFEKFLRDRDGAGKVRRASRMTPLELAQGIVDVSNATMEKALRVISIERGHDPREFSLVCYGGAGGLHAAELARSLGLERVLVPQNPGTFSAMGILLSDIVKDLSQSVLLPVAFAGKQTRSSRSQKLFEKLERRFARLEQAARAELRRDQMPGGPVKVERRLDIRYAGQSYELSVPFTRRFGELFHREHEKAYGYRDTARPLEIVNLRIRLVIPTPKPRLQQGRVAGNAGGGLLVKKKAAWFGGRRHRTPFYNRDALRPGARFRGPAVVVEYSSTIVVPPGFVCRVDEYHNLVLTQHAR
ncbi:MAG: hydantoinase/oxoprolinase family protein [Acidobacteria bacterium]|nr:hydantoinase/oxoprolinase family protein [Acidobacteriota bacterium]